MSRMLSWSQKIEARTFPADFCTRNFWDVVSRYAATPLIVALSLGHSDITTFRPWSLIAPDGKLFESRRKNSKTFSDNWHRWRFLSAFRHFGTHFAERFRMSKSSWMMDPTRSREMSSFWATDLAEIWQSSKSSSWIWSIISGVVNVLGRPVRGSSQVEKSPRLTWANQFLMVAYDGACFPNVCVRMAWISFGLCLAGKNTEWELASRCCCNRARRLTCFLSASLTRKYLQFGTWTDPSFQRHYRFRSMTSGRMSD